MNTLTMVQSRRDVNGNVQDLVAHRLATEKWKWVRRVLARRDLSFAAKAVATAIAQFVSPESPAAWPSHATLAEAVGASDRHVRRSIDELQKAGLVTIREKGGGTAKVGQTLSGRTCLYELAESLPGRICPGREDAYPDKTDGDTRTDSSYNPYIDPLREILTVKKESKKDSPKEESLENSGCARDLELSAHSVESSKAWPVGMVRPASDARSVRARIGTAACQMLGYGIDDRWFDGRYPDEAILSKIPSDTLAAMAGQCRRGQLSRKHLAMVLSTLGLPTRRAENAELPPVPQRLLAQ